MEEVRKAVHCIQTGKRVTDQFYVDEDVNVPDVREDVAKVILAGGRVRVEDIKMTENYARITGKITYQILYETENEIQKVSALQGKLSFEEMVYMEDEPVGKLYVRSSFAELNVTVIHSRKLNIRVAVDLEVSSEGESEEILTTDVETSEPVYKRFRTEEILKLHSMKKDIYRIKEEMKIPASKENIGTLLYGEANLRKLDTRLGTDELLLRGEIQLFCLYESQEQKMEWVEQNIPFEGKLECYGAEDTMYHDIQASLTDENIDIRMDEDGEMRIFGLEASLEVRCSVYEEEKTEILDDLYSLTKELIPAREEKALERLVMQNHSRCKAAEQLNLPELKDGMLQICHCSGRLQMEYTKIVPEGIQVEGVIHIGMLYIKADDEVPFDVWQGMIPYSHIIECPKAEETMRYDISGTVEQLSVSLLGGGEAEVKAVLGFQILLREAVMVENIEQIEEREIDEKEAENAPGIVGYIVKEGDDLWNLAKRYHTTEEGIQEVNEMDGRQIKAGDRILIFKENMSIL